MKGKPEGRQSYDSKLSDKRFSLSRVVRMSALVISLLFMILGILIHQPDAVWIKAIKICLECVGIG